MRRPDAIDWLVIATMSFWLLGLCCLIGCATVGRVERIEQEVSGIRTQIGGGGDSVTAWIMATGLVAALFYPVVWRPIRKRFEQNGDDTQSTGGDGSQ